MKPAKVAIIGCGNIAPQYCNNAPRFSAFQVVAGADLNPENSKQLAERFPYLQARSIDEVLADPEIEIILNLTPVGAHLPVCRQALKAGKHVYTEKPLTVKKAESVALLEEAAAANLVVGGAPDTFLNAPTQNALAAIQRGDIGDLISGSAALLNAGMEHWHPAPEIYYGPAGGPLFTMGPYYMTVLAALFGPAEEVFAHHKITYPKRKITGQVRNGEWFEVESPTHLSGSIRFANGAIITTTFSYETYGRSDLPHLEVHGSEGSLSIPDPNRFDNVTRIARRLPEGERGQQQWEEVEKIYDHSGCRGQGLEDMVFAIREGRKPRASGELALHALDIMESLERSGYDGKPVSLTTTCTPPPPLPVGYSLPKVG